MDVLKTILQRAGESKQLFLVIGGQAINAHGFARQTGDLDILAPQDSWDWWKDILHSLKYQEFQKTEVFARFKPSQIAAWPIDLMLVAPNTFNQMYQEGSEVLFGQAKVKIPSIRHMISLKLHAMKQRLEHRESKDLLDIIELRKISKINDEELLELCTKYDRIDVYEKIVG